MTGYERLVGSLTGLNLYRLDGNSLIDAELKAYGMLLDDIYNKMEQLFESSFIDQLSGIGLKNYVKLFGVSEALSNATIQDLVLKRFAITNNDFTKVGILHCIEAGGFTATITETPASKAVTVKVTKDKNFYTTRAEQEAYIKSCMPCHVKPTIVWST